MRGRQDIIFFLILSILISLFFVFKISNYDIWWHLALGKYIISNFSIPQFDVFSYTIDPQKTWLIISWLFAPISYIVFSLFSINGLIIAKVLVGISCFYALFMRSKLYYKENQYLVLLFLIIAIFAMRDRFLVRPHTAGFLFACLHFLFLDLYIQRDKRYIIPLLITQILWVNFHPSFFLGIIIPLIYLAGFILEKKDSNDLKKLIVAFALVLFSILINPNGIARVSYIFNMFFNEQLYWVREYMPFSSYLSLKGLFIIIAFLLLLLCIRKMNFTLALIVIIFGCLGMRSYRFFNIFMISFLPLCPLYLFRYLDKLVSFFENNQIMGKVLVIGTASILAFVSFFTKPSWGLGLERFTYPQNAVDVLKKENMLEQTEGEFFNSYNFGGYLIWRLYPNHKVFIDGRIHLYYGKLFSAYLDIVKDHSLWTEVVNRYNIQVALVRYPHFGRDRRLYDYTSQMFDDKMWSLIYFDDVAIVYIRKNEKNKELINRYQFNYIKPQNLDPKYLDIYLSDPLDLYKLMDEMSRAFSLSPESFRLYSLRAYINSRLGKHDEAVSDLVHSLKINPDLKEAKIILKHNYRIPNYKLLMRW